jgi:hypothetical protein
LDDDPGLAPGRAGAGAWVLAGQRGADQRAGLLRLLLDSAPEAAQGHERGDGHDHDHPVEHVAGGRGEVGADELRDVGDVAYDEMAGRLAWAAEAARASGPGPDRPSQPAADREAGQ